MNQTAQMMMILKAFFNQQQHSSQVGNMYQTSVSNMGVPSSSQFDSSQSLPASFNCDCQQPQSSQQKSDECLQTSTPLAQAFNQQQSSQINYEQFVETLTSMPALDPVQQYPRN